jgi:hypothetical protein
MNFTLLNFGYLLEPISKSGKFEPSFHKNSFECAQIIIILLLLLLLFRFLNENIRQSKTLALTLEGSIN